MGKKRCAVIGAGLGGLSAAALLARSGLQVDIFEQNSTPGGKTNTLCMNGFRFDTGPSILTMPFVLDSLFHDCGEKADDYFSLEPLKILCRYYYPSGTLINTWADIQSFADEIEVNTSDSAESLFRYLDYCRDIYDFSAELFLFNSFHEFSTFRKHSSPGMLFGIKKIDPFRTVHRANCSFFSDPHLIQLFDRYATYNGSNPYRAPATLNIIPHVENTLGAYCVNGGMIEITRSLERLCRKMGVRFHYQAPVTAIMTRNKAVTGLRIDELTISCEIVVSNADVNFTYQNLLADSRTRGARKYRTLEASSSALVFYWGVKKTFPELEIHNIIFSADYRREFHEIFSEKRCPSDPTVYIYISSKYNRADAPEDCENWYVLVNAPNNAGQNWEKEIALSRGAVIKKIKSRLGIDIEPVIMNEYILAPPDIERITSSNRGSIYGISSNNRTAAFLRQRNRSTAYQGLYFCGGSAHPGGGIPLVVLSGKITADLIRKYEL